jgi:hypothetical protein
LVFEEWVEVLPDDSGGEWIRAGLSEDGNEDGDGGEFGFSGGGDSGLESDGGVRIVLSGSNLAGKGCGDGW